MMSQPMTEPLSLPAHNRAPELRVATDSTVDVLAPRERVRNMVAARLFGDAVMPARIDRFELIRELGAGGMGAVYAAHDPRLDRTIALKVLARAGEGQVANTRLVREAQAMARLRHPNVVAVHEVGTSGEQVFVAMELVEGGTLAEWIRGGPRPWREVLALLIPAGRGLAAAHAAGLVHRDFKPANVLIGADGRALVSDFGLARAGAEPDGGRPLAETEATAEMQRSLLESPLTRTGALLGTPAYMSPEQFRGEPATPRSDVFAFCVVVWEAIFGRRPFAGETVTELIAAIEGGRIAAPPRSIRIPRALRSELLRGMSAHSGARHASMQELLAALERVGRSSLLRRVLVGLGVVFVAITAVMMYALTLTRPPATDTLSDDDRFLLWATKQRQRAETPPTPPPQTVARDEFFATVGTMEVLGQHARVMPSIKEGVFQGLKFYGIRPDTPLKRYGFYNGDLLTAIDGRPLTGAASLATEMQAAAADGEVTLTVTRRAMTAPFVFRLVDAPAPAAAP